jgi:hypothetical protein
VLDELQLLGVLVRGAEEALARAEEEREDKQVVPVSRKPLWAPSKKPVTGHPLNYARCASRASSPARATTEEA